MEERRIEKGRENSKSPITMNVNYITERKKNKLKGTNIQINEDFVKASESSNRN